MKVVDKIKDMLQPVSEATLPATDVDTAGGDLEKDQDAIRRSLSELDDEAGVANIKAAQSVWGKAGFYWVCFG